MMPWPCCFATQSTFLPSIRSVRCTGRSAAVVNVFATVFYTEAEENNVDISQTDGSGVNAFGEIVIDNVDVGSITGRLDRNHGHGPFRDAPAPWVVFDL